MKNFKANKSDMSMDDLLTYAKDTWDVVEIAIETADKLLLHGPPGTGKTRAACKFGNPEDLYKITLHEEMSAATIEGHFIPDGDKFEWHDGLGIRAWRSGGRLVCDEIDRSSGDVQTKMYAIGDDPDVAELALPTGEIVHPSDGFQFFATMNGHPNDLPPALRDRFDITVEVNLPHPDVITALDKELREVAKRDIFDPDRDKSSVREWIAYDKMRKRGTASDMQIAQMIWGKSDGKKIVEALALENA